MKTIKLVVAGLIIGGLFLASCEQTETDIIKTNDETVQSILSITDLYNTEDAEEATSDNSTKTEVELLNACFTRTINENEDGAFWPRSWTLDFGTENCESFNGVLRRGVINVILTDHWRNEGSLRTITYQGFYVNDVQLEGIKTIENTGLNDAENMTWARKMTDGKLSYEDGTAATWQCERFSELVEGGDTWLFADDIYMVTGGGNGVNQENLAFTTEITIPLEYIFGCRFPVSGELTINIEGSETIVIDYGNGECDNLASQTIGDEVTEIELGK
ncbi:MAG: hypothetical protein B6I20_12860 [Bacteroidetes bacterium 4572_117]|nr:MAG: hypothetical protein B6I20_12860 [Bacteroidetes bacterium 4572_117]